MSTTEKKGTLSDDLSARYSEKPPRRHQYMQQKVALDILVIGDATECMSIC